MISFAMRLILGGTFLWAASTKFKDLSSFRSAVHAFAVTPGRFVTPISRLIPVFELVLGLLVLFGIQVRTAAIAGGLLLFVFTLAVLFNLRRGHRVSCACFGASTRPVGIETLIRNVGLILLAAAVAQFSASQPVVQPLEVLAATLIGASVIEIWLLVTLTWRVHALATAVVEVS